MFKIQISEYVLKAKTNMKACIELLLNYGKILFFTKNQSFCNDIILLA